MGKWLEKWSGGMFSGKGVNDPKHISAIATPAHQMITDEQTKFWKQVAFKNEIEFTSYKQLVWDLKSLPDEKQKQIFAEYKEFVEEQKKNYAGYFFSGNATLQDIDNAHAKTIDPNQSPKHLTGELLEDFKEKQVKYQVNTSQALARLRSRIDEGLEVAQTAAQRAGKWSKWLKSAGALMGILALSNSAKAIYNPNAEQEHALYMTTVRYRQSLDQLIYNHNLPGNMRRNFADELKNLLDKLGVKEEVNNLIWMKAYEDASKH